MLASAAKRCKSLAAETRSTAGETTDCSRARRAVERASDAGSKEQSSSAAAAQ